MSWLRATLTPLHLLCLNFIYINMHYILAINFIYRRRDCSYTCVSSNYSTLRLNRRMLIIHVVEKENSNRTRRTTPPTLYPVRYATRCIWDRMEMCERNVWPLSTSGPELWEILWFVVNLFHEHISISFMIIGTGNINCSIYTIKGTSTWTLI